MAKPNEMRSTGVRMPEIPVGPEEEYVGLAAKLEELKAVLAKEGARLELQREERARLEKELEEKGVDLNHPKAEKERLESEAESHLGKVRQRITEFEAKIKGTLGQVTEEEEPAIIDLH